MNCESKKLVVACLSSAILLSAPAFGASAVANGESVRQETAAEATDKPVLLKGGVAATVSPIAEDGSKNELPVGLPLSLTLMANLNSELTKVGDGVAAMVSIDVKDGGKTVLPGQWFVAGKVAQVAGQRRLGRDGYLTVHFDKLVSPDGKHVIPIDVTASTKESTAKSVAKVVAKDSVYVSKGAIKGAILSVQLTGIPLAIATHGYSVAGGAAFGATLGLIGALKRKGNIATGMQGEELRFKLDKPVVLPAFNESALPSAQPLPKVENLDFAVDKVQFRADPNGDKRSRIMQVDFKVTNNTDREYCFSNLAIVSDHNQMYYPYVHLKTMTERQKRVAPKCKESGSMLFSVANSKQKYYLVLLDRGNADELARIPLN